MWSPSLTLLTGEFMAFNYANQKKIFTVLKRNNHSISIFPEWNHMYRKVYHRLLGCSNFAETLESFLLKITRSIFFLKMATVNSRETKTNLEGKQILERLGSPRFFLWIKHSRSFLQPISHGENRAGKVRL